MASEGRAEFALRGVLALLFLRRRALAATAYLARRVTAITSLSRRPSHPRQRERIPVNSITPAATECEVNERSSFHAVEGASVMTKFSTAFAVALIAAGLIATTTYGRVEPQPAPAQISPIQMMTGQHLQQTEMTDMSLVFAR